MSNYDAWMKNHLAFYKTHRLGVLESGIWKQRNLPYAHILPEALYKLNILETYRAEFWSYAEERGDVKLHRDFHHLNSSQAMCFNLFYPFIHDIQATHNLFAHLFERIDHAERIDFEVIIDPIEGTNFDFYVKLPERRHYFFELKLTEREFGIVKPTTQHLSKLASLYTSRLSEKIPKYLLEPALFFQYYQLLRNISYLQKETNDILFIVFPQNNANLMASIHRFLANVPSATQKQIRIIYLETLIDRILSHENKIKPAFTAHYVLFKEKYLG